MNNVTIIVALITALAAIVAPVITQFIAQRGAYRLKSLELFFAEKAKVYRKYINVTSKFPPEPKLDDLMKLNNALNQALVYSSKDTGRKLTAYVFQLRKTKNPDLDAIAETHLEAFLAIHAELARYGYYAKDKHHRS